MPDEPYLIDGNKLLQDARNILDLMDLTLLTATDALAYQKILAYRTATQNVIDSVLEGYYDVEA